MVPHRPGEGRVPPDTRVGGARALQAHPREGQMPDRKYKSTHSRGTNVSGPAPAADTPATSGRSGDWPDQPILDPDQCVGELPSLPLTSYPEESLSLPLTSYPEDPVVIDLPEDTTLTQISPEGKLGSSPEAADLSLAATLPEPTSVCCSWDSPDAAAGLWLLLGMQWSGGPESPPATHTLGGSLPLSQAAQSLKPGCAIYLCLLSPCLRV